MLMLLTISFFGVLSVKSDPIQCEIVPIKTANGLMGHCCLFKKAALNEQKQDKLIDHLLKNFHADNGTVKSEPNRRQNSEHKQASYKPIVSNAEESVTTEQSVYKNYKQRKLPATEQMAGHPRGSSSTEDPSESEADVTIDNRFNIDSPIRCKTGKKTSDGNCEVIFG